MILLRACNISHSQFLSLTESLHHRLPNNEREFESLCQRLRRMGHVLEAFPNNVASSLRPASNQQQRTYYVGDQSAPPDPWQSDDPWQQPNYDDPWSGGQEDPWSSSSQGAYAATTGEWAFMTEDLYETDTETEFDDQSDVDLSDLSELPDAEATQ
eukprot:6381018-Amphidinium_carterae.1